MLMKRISELEHIMANLIQDNKHLEERLDSHRARLYTLENLDIPQQETNSYKTHKDHMMLCEALKKSMNRDHTDELLKYLAEARKKKKKRRDSSKMPPGSPPHPPPPAGPSRTSGSPGASGSSQVPPLPPPPPSTNQEDLHMDDDMVHDAQAHSSDDEDIGNAHILKVNLRQDWWKPLEKDIPTTPEPAWSIPSSDVPISKSNWASALASTYSPPPEDSLLAQTECHKLLTDSVGDSIIRHNVSKPLPLGGPPGQVIIQSDFFFNKDLECLRYDSKGSRPALSISKMKVAYSLDVGLEQMVPDEMWIEEECKYDIAAIAVRTHMWILSLVRIEVFSVYGYDYMKKTVLRRADLNEHIIAERDFKYLYPSDFEDLYLLNLQDIEDNVMDPVTHKFNPLYPFKVAVCFSLRSLKPKRTIESRAKRSSKIISLGHYSIMIASSHTVKIKTDIKSPMHYPCGIARTSE
nr:hypothetical protein [Tanacetum cinerariifolium]